jgi:hypothetical protein
MPVACRFAAAVLIDVFMNAFALGLQAIGQRD